MAGRTQGSVFVLVVLAHRDSNEMVIDIYQALSKKGLDLYEGLKSSVLRLEKTIEKWEGSLTQSAVVIEVKESSHQKDLLELFKGIGLEEIAIERHIEQAGKILLSVDNLEAVLYAFGGRENFVREMKDYRGLEYQPQNQRLELKGLFVQIKSAKKKIEEMMDKVKVPFIEVNRVMFKYLETFYKRELNKFGEFEVQDSPLSKDSCLIKSKAKKYEEWDPNVKGLKMFYGEKTQGLQLWSLTAPEGLNVSKADSELCKKLMETGLLAVCSALDGKIKIVCTISYIEEVKQMAQVIFDKWLPSQQAESGSASAVEINVTNNHGNKENDRKYEKQELGVDEGDTIV